MDSQEVGTWFSVADGIPGKYLTNLESARELGQKVRGDILNRENDKQVLKL